MRNTFLFTCCLLIFCTVYGQGKVEMIGRYSNLNQLANTLPNIAFWGIDSMGAHLYVNGVLKKSIKSKHQPKPKLNKNDPNGFSYVLNSTYFRIQNKCLLAGDYHEAYDSPYYISNLQIIDNSGDVIHTTKYGVQVILVQTRNKYFVGFSYDRYWSPPYSFSITSKEQTDTFSLSMGVNNWCYQFDLNTDQFLIYLIKNDSLFRYTYGKTGLVNKYFIHDNISFKHIISMRSSPDDKYLSVCSRDSSIIINLQNNKIIESTIRYDECHGFFNNGHHILVNSKNDHTSLYNLLTKEMRWLKAIPSWRNIAGIIYSNDIAILSTRNMAGSKLVDREIISIDTLGHTQEFHIPNESNNSINCNIDGYSLDPFFINDSIFIVGSSPCISERKSYPKYYYCFKLTN
ncbi:MAG: hypothetical protein Q7U71_07385 [bacterium]|nr:hypothetical protein [bacterium]